MTTSSTQDVPATADQIERLAHAGCEIVRVTVPSLRDAESLRAIRAELERRRVRVPLVADIHFTPNAALVAAESVEKIRINPGNFADKKRFEVREYTDAEYARELERLAERFRPLVRRCRELGRAVRIGTNHGSLSDRVLNRYGDTPRGMVESALEFLDVCENEGFRDVVFSMKASNPQVAVHAYRLLAARLAERAPDEPGYPFHVGVTEAGDGEDGRIKSAIGIGTLLEDGLGDTIRVSLTEDSVREIPVARALAERYEKRWTESAPTRAGAPEATFADSYFAYARRTTAPVSRGAVRLGGSEPVRVELEWETVPDDPAAAVRVLAAAKVERPALACEGLRVDATMPDALARARVLETALRDAGLEILVALRLRPADVPVAADLGDRWIVPVRPGTDATELSRAASAACAAETPVEWCLEANPEEIPALLEAVLEVSREAGIRDVLLSARSPRAVHAARRLAAELRARRLEAPVVLLATGTPELEGEAALLEAAVDLGAPLLDGFGDAIALPATPDAPLRALDRAYRILQGARLRTTWTEFISCPSCGRTLFDLEETTARIKARTQHLKGVKIAIMGCIVNGPGEMADADFGYVGSGPGLVNLYVGKELVARHVPTAEADDRLVELIRTHGRWIDP